MRGVGCNPKSAITTEVPALEELDRFTFPLFFGPIGLTVRAPIIKEVPMFRTNRLQPDFDSLESEFLLSPGVATASSPAHLDSVFGERLELNGILHGNKTVLEVDARLPLAADSQIEDGTLSYFDTSGRLSTMGKVSGSFGPNRATDPPLGQLPDLSNLTLELSNHSGSVQLTLSPSTTNDYQFTVSGGTGNYAVAYGSGSLTITFRPSSNEYLLRLQSAKV
jgi:hypothetical protein